MLHQRNGGRLHERPSPCKPSHGVPQTGAVRHRLRWKNVQKRSKNLVCSVLFPAHRFKEAEEDCSRAISLDNTYSKAFARRGTARAALRKPLEAKQGDGVLAVEDSVQQVELL